MHCTCWKDHYQARGATTLPPHSGRWVCKTPPIPCVDCEMHRFNALCAWMCRLKVGTFGNQQVFSSHLCQDSVKILTPKGLQSPNGLRFTSVKLTWSRLWDWESCPGSFTPCLMMYFLHFWLGWRIQTRDNTRMSWFQVFDMIGIARPHCLVGVVRCWPWSTVELSCRVRISLGLLCLPAKRRSQSFLQGQARVNPHT